MRDLSGVKFGSLGRWISGKAFVKKEYGQYRDGITFIAEYETSKKITLSGFLQFNTKEDSQAAINTVSPDKFIVWKKTRFALVNLFYPYMGIDPLAAEARLYSHGEPSKKMLKFLGEERP